MSLTSSSKHYTVLLCLLYLALVGFTKISSGSKFNEVVIRNISDLFNNRTTTNASITATTIDKGQNGTLPSNPERPWKNEGFLPVNATEVMDPEENKATDTNNTSINVLLAVKPASLTTNLIDFDHTFLVIRFSSIIGYSGETEDVDTSSTTTEETDESTTTEASADESSTAPTASKVDSLGTPKDTDGSSPKKEVTTSTPRSNSQSTTTTTTTPAPPAIIKLTAEGSRGQQVIAVSMDKEQLAKTLLKSNKRSKASSVSASAESMEMSQLSHSKEIKGGVGRRFRRKRESSVSVSSEESLSELQKLLMKSLKEKEKRKPKTIMKHGSNSQEESQSHQDESTQEELMPKDEETSKKLSYQTWKASMDKSFRPPGFYVTVDEKVVFDNWAGVWNSPVSPAVMGRTNLRRGEIWNDTEILLQYHEHPGKNIKISFEWEPVMDASSYLFLSNISIFTYGLGSSTNESVQNGTDNSVPSSKDNRNITLYIVLQAPNQTAQQVIRMGEDSDGVQHTVSVLPPTVPVKAGKVHETTTSRPTKPPRNNGNTALIVACATGALSLLVLGFAVYKKLRVDKNPNNSKRAMTMRELNLL